MSAYQTTGVRDAATREENIYSEVNRNQLHRQLRGFFASSGERDDTPCTWSVRGGIGSGRLEMAWRSPFKDRK